MSSYRCAGELLTAAGMLQIVLYFMHSVKILSIFEFAVQIVFGLEFVLIESFIPKVDTFIKGNEEFFYVIFHG